MRFTQICGTAIALVAACALFGRGAELPKKPVKVAPPAVKAEAKKPAVKDAKPVGKDACPDGKCPAPQARAPKGGVVVAGRFYAGGWFLPMPRGNGPTVVKVSQPLLSARMKARVRAFVVRSMVRGTALRLVGR